MTKFKKTLSALTIVSTLAIASGASATVIIIPGPTPKPVPAGTRVSMNCLVKFTPTNCGWSYHTGGRTTFIDANRFHIGYDKSLAKTACNMYNYLQAMFVLHKPLTIVGSLTGPISHSNPTIKTAAIKC